MSLVLVFVCSVNLMDVFIETLHVYKNNTVIQILFKKYCVFIVLLV